MQPRTTLELESTPVSKFDCDEDDSAFNLNPDFFLSLRHYYEVSVSNDGGATGSAFPADLFEDEEEEEEEEKRRQLADLRLTVSDFSAVFLGDARLDVPAAVRAEMGTSFTVTMWAWLTTVSDVRQELVRLPAGTGVFHERDVLFASANGKAVQA